VDVLLSLTAVVPYNFFEGKNIRQSFELLEDTFEKQFDQHNVDAAEMGAAIELYCERYFETPPPRFSVSKTTELFSCIKKLPYHNFLSVEILMRLANSSGIKYLNDLIEEYKRTYFDQKLFKLFLGKSIKQIQVITAEDTFVINSCRSNTVLKEDVTINELKDFTITYTKQILCLDAGIALPHCIVKGSICIEWLIPQSLADYAFHSACLNTEMFSELNIVSITIGNYQIKPVEGSMKSTYSICICD